MFWKKKEVRRETYDRENWEPVLRCSICTGEQVAGFRNLANGQFREECLVRTKDDVERFRAKYGIETELKKIY